MHPYCKAVLWGWCIGTFLGIALVIYGTIVAPPAYPQEPKLTVTKKYRVYPVHYKERRIRFTPWARPTPQQVSQIIAVESARWRASQWTLQRRLYCESHYQWNAANGAYRGLGQFAWGTFTRGLSTIRTRKVRFTVSRILWRPTRIVKIWSDGHRTSKRGFKVKIRRTRHYYGWIDPHPDWTHGWAQVRIAAQANAGISAVSDSEWSCR